jgi:hypothetical protein
MILGVTNCGAHHPERGLEASVDTSKQGFLSGRSARTSVVSRLMRMRQVFVEASFWSRGTLHLFTGRFESTAAWEEAREPGYRDRTWRESMMSQERETLVGQPVRTSVPRVVLARM